MTAWTNEELTRIGAAEELQIASARSDGTLRSPVTIWVVRNGDDLFVRAVRGRGGWFRGSLASHEGHIRAGGVSRDVAFVEPDPGVADALDAAYRSKYRRYAESIVGSVVTPAARSATLKLVPR